MSGKHQARAVPPEMPGCMLKPYMRAANCIPRECASCGWNGDEYVRRKVRIRKKGLTLDPETGLKRLVIPRRRSW